MKHLKNLDICFLGAGNIAEALISGLVSSNKKVSKRITVSDIRKERLSYLVSKFKVKAAENNIEAIDSNDVVILAVKPQQITALLEEIAGKVTEEHLVISVAAGITTDYIEKCLGKIPVMRTMPNTPVLVGEGMIAICEGEYTQKKHEDIARELVSACGTVLNLKEEYFDTATAISGSGPAYVAYLAEAMMAAGEELGLEPEIAHLLAVQTIFGTGKLMKETGENPEILRNRVTSPGGTTEKAIEWFKKHNLTKIITEAISKAKERSTELTR